MLERVVPGDLQPNEVVSLCCPAVADSALGVVADIRVLNDFVIGALFDATIEATEEAILNALVAAETMTGRDGITAYALPHDRLLETMTRFGRPARTVA